MEAQAELYYDSVLEEYLEELRGLVTKWADAKDYEMERFGQRNNPDRRDNNSDRRGNNSDTIPGSYPTRRSTWRPKQTSPLTLPQEEKSSLTPTTPTLLWEEKLSPTTTPTLLREEKSSPTPTTTPITSRNQL